MRLKKLLESSPGGGRVVWTGSRSASNAPCVFDAADMQHVHGSEAYGASKFLVDLVNVSTVAAVGGGRCSCVVRV